MELINEGLERIKEVNLKNNLYGKEALTELIKCLYVYLGGETNLEVYDNIKEQYFKVFKDYSNEELKIILSKVINDDSNWKYDTHVGEQLSKLIYELFEIDFGGCGILNFGENNFSFLMNFMNFDKQKKLIEKDIYNLSYTPYSKELSKMIGYIYTNNDTSIASFMMDEDDTDRNLPYQKVFAFSPLGLKQNKINKLSSTRLFPEIDLNSISSIPWYYADLFLKNEPNFKGIIIADGSSLYGDASKEYRKKFIESGYLEGVIELPNNTLSGAGIRIFLLILSNENKCVKFLDASDLKYENKSIKKTSKIVNLNVGEILYRYKNECLSIDIERASKFTNLIPSIVISSLENKLSNAIKLKDVALIFNGSQYTLKNFENQICEEETGYSILTSNDINEDNIDVDNLNHIRVKDNKLDKYCLQYGDVIVTSKSSNIKVGVVNFIPKEKIIVTGGLIIVRPNPIKLNGTYLKLFMNSNLGKKLIKNIQKGEYIVYISPNSLGDFEIPLVDLEEQNKIVSAYDKQLSSLLALKAEVKRISDKLATLINDNFKD